jgi:signal transduction histidine kinase
MTRNGNSTLAVYPIQQEDGKLLALLILINLAADVPPSLAEVLTLAVTSLLLITVAVGLLGGIFGYLSSRFLVRHVRGLAEATARWGQGDFSLAVVQSDKVENELDALALHLDQLRPQIQESLALREAVAVQGERQRIAQELHDSVKQQIFTLRMNLATLQTIQEADPPAFQSYLQNAMSLAENAQHELTSIIQVFYQPVKAKSSPTERLHALITEWSGQTRIACKAEIEADLTLAMDAEHGLRRILQESLANVYKHSGAQHVKIEIKQSNGDLHVSIKDNGCGFEADVPQQGVGLLSIQERVRSLAGSIQIESSPAGTTLLIRFPLKPEPALSGLDKS